MTLTITYTGDPFRIDEHALAAWLDADQPYVPDRYSDESGQDAARLFLEACEHGAIVTPEGLTPELYADDDSDGGGFTLVVYPSPAGERVRDALDYFVAELNTALGIAAATAAEAPPMSDAQGVALAGIARRFNANAVRVAMRPFDLPEGYLLVTLTPGSGGDFVCGISPTGEISS
jgi:hypothetical protein